MAEKYFQQAPPEVTLDDLWSGDVFLQSALSYTVPSGTLKLINNDIQGFIDEYGAKMKELDREARAMPPTHHVYDAFGNYVDYIQVSRAWMDLHDIAAREGLLATAYERQLGAFSRLHSQLKINVFRPVSAIVTCPLAMTDGAARLIEQVIGSEPNQQVKDKLRFLLQRFTTRSAEDFYTSGQWMTERPGGSDLSRTETVARTAPNGGSSEYLLTGYKWFTSATTANVTFTLARVEDDSRLSLFVADVANLGEAKKRQTIKIHRLKDKFGTVPLPTAELELTDLPALMIGKRGQGVKQISTLFNLTRIWTIQAAAGASRQMMALMKDYAHKRQVGRKMLKDNALHVNTLFDLEATSRAMTLLFIDVSVLLGKSETEPRDDRTEALLRILTPIGKAWCSKEATRMATETMESFGGTGYTRPSGMPGLLADVMVNQIWEGTTNVLAMDLIRILSKTPGVLAHFEAAIFEKAPDNANIRQSIANVRTALGTTSAGVGGVDPRALTFALCTTYCGALLVEYANNTGRREDAALAHHFVRERTFAPRVDMSVQQRALFGGAAADDDAVPRVKSAL